MNHDEMMSTVLSNLLYNYDRALYNRLTRSGIHTLSASRAQRMLDESQVAVIGSDPRLTDDEVKQLSSALTVARNILQALPILPGVKREVLQAVAQEHQYQDDKHGKNREQSLPGYLLVMEAELAEAKHGWCKNLEGRSSALHETLQVVAVGLRCLNDYGVTGWAASTRDKRLS